MISELDGRHVIRGPRMMYGCGYRGKHEADVEVIFLFAMKSNDLTGCLQLQPSVCWRELMSPLSSGTDIHPTYT